jgi:hypothetical protein
MSVFLWDVTAVAFTGAVMFFIGLYIGGKDMSNQLDDCAKKHNVYRCEMVAVPGTANEGE